MRKALEIAKRVANEQTDPKSVSITLIGDIQITTHRGSDGDNEEMAQAILSELEKEGIEYEIWCANPTNIILRPKHSPLD